MNIDSFSEKIIDLVGGVENIEHVFHCITRLRFRLINKNLLNRELLQNLEGVYGVNFVGDEFQIIIGNRVFEVCQYIQKRININNSTSLDKKKLEKIDKNKISSFIDTISGIFLPIIPAISGAGVLKGILSLLLSLGLITVDSNNYKILYAVSDGIFYLLPVVLSYSSAKKFKCNPYVAVALAAALFHPNLINVFIESKQSGINVELFGLPITSVSYVGSVLPIIFAIWLMSYVEKILNNIIHSSIKTMFVPLCSLLIIAPLMLSIIGPMGIFIGNKLSLLVVWLLSNLGAVAGFIVGGSMSLIVMTGMHYTLVPIMVNNISHMGFDPIKILFFVANLGQAGAAFGVYLKSKNANMKSLALSTSFTAAMGVTEPAMYGVNIRLKKPFIAALIGGAIGGACGVGFGVKAYAFTLSGLPGLPAFIGHTFIYALLCLIISFVSSAVITYIIGFDDPFEEKNNNTLVGNKLIDHSVDFIEIYSPVQGTLQSLDSIDDAIFSSGLLGNGAAIIPEQGVICAPVNGVISSIFPTKHAIAITSDNGVEILIHIGIDTVKLNGKCFESNIKDGDQIKIGEPLVNFDLKALNELNVDPTVVMIVTNSESYKLFLIEDVFSISQGDLLFKLN